MQHGLEVLLQLFLAFAQARRHQRAEAAGEVVERVEVDHWRGLLLVAPSFGPRVGAAQSAVAALPGRKNLMAIVGRVSTCRSDGDGTVGPFAFVRGDGVAGWRMAGRDPPYAVGRGMITTRRHAAAKLRTPPALADPARAAYPRRSNRR
ncbi:hypothetical protein GCM10027432_21820 [Lysobacter fragariae]